MRIFFSLIMFGIAHILMPASVAKAEQAGEWLYPELNVVPKASELVLREAKDRNRFGDYLPIQIAATLNLVSGLQIMGESLPDSTDRRAEKEEALRNTGLAQALVGAAWLGTTIALDFNYDPYRSGWLDMRRTKVNSKRDELAFERQAEEILDNAAALDRKIMYLAMASNSVVAIANLSQSEKDLTKVQAGMALAASLTSYLFQSEKIGIYKRHLDHKKRIYGPISSRIGINPFSKQFALLLGSSVYF